MRSLHLLAPDHHHRCADDDRAHPRDPRSPSRRNFLIRSSQGLAAALIPTTLRRWTLASLTAPDSPTPLSPDNEFHLQPHYRSQVPLDAVLLKRKAGRDEFISEKYADRIADILADWTAALLRSPQDLAAIERVLSPQFQGSSPRPSESRLLRTGPLEIRQNRFQQQRPLGRDAFLREFESALRPFSGILTAEFQVTSIQAPGTELLSKLCMDSAPSAVKGPCPQGSLSKASPPERLETRIRYELVGSGRDFHREQRVGYWDLEWQPASDSSSDSKFLLESWQMLDETRSRSADPMFLDITASALGGNASYAAQLLHGSDYWRTVLDGACGIDIYGHNGISVGDIDNDGFDDLYICQPAGLPNRLYRNCGDGTFEDITEKSGAGILENTACALFADINNDGNEDLIVVRSNGPLLLLNEGNGKFRSQPHAFKFATEPQGTFTGAALADYDRDGWLDIYFCLYIYYQGTDQYRYPTPYYAAENGPPNFMMCNNRDGTFRDITKESHLDQNNTRYSFCCGWNDFNHDGWPDLYVVNDFGRKNLYRNNGHGTFTDVAAQTGVDDVGAGMSVCWFDYDNDGADDLYVANMWSAPGERISNQPNFQKDVPEEVRALYHKHALGNSLLRNKGEGTFQDATTSAVVGMGRWSWSSDAWDFDHDGYPDLYVSNGMVTGPSRDDLNSFFWRQVVARSPREAKPSHDYELGWNAINELIRSDGTWSGFERNVFYANNRDGTFSDVSGVVGLDFIEDGRAFALADVDHDGRLEVFLKNRNAPQLRLLKNTTKDLPPAISFRLQGIKSNRSAVGASITVETNLARQTRTLQAGSGFLSQHSKEMFFGLGDVKGPVEATIRWPSGLVQQLQDLPLNHRIWVEEGSPPTRMEPFPARPHQPTQVAAPNPQPTELLPDTVQTWLLAPIAAPHFSLPDLNGRTRTLADLRGKPVLLNLWQTKSPRCRQDLETFKRLHQSWATQGVQLLTINADDPNPATPLHAFAAEHKFTFPILRSSDDLAAVYNILYRYLFDRHRDLALPTSFLIDEKGDIIKIYQGPVNPKQLEDDFRHIPESNGDRLAQALPFRGITDVTEFSRNHLSYGSAYFQRGYYDQAAASFRQALRDDPGSAEAMYGLGSVYLQQQKSEDARQTFERAIQLHASYPDTLPNAWNNLGLLATREGRTAEAIPYFQKALKLSPDHLIALENLGNAYRQQKQWEQARQVLEHAVEVGPEYPEANYSLGMVFAQLNDTDRAYDYLQKALKLRPAYPEALNNLGVLYLRTSRRDQAVASFEECIRMAPAFDQSYLNLARVYTIEGDSTKARAVLLELLKRDPKHPQAQKMLDQLQ